MLSSTVNIFSPHGNSRRRSGWQFRDLKRSGSLRNTHCKDVMQTTSPENAGRIGAIGPWRCDGGPLFPATFTKVFRSPSFSMKGFVRSPVSAVSLLVDDLNKSDVRLSPSAALSPPFLCLTLDEQTTVVHLFPACRPGSPPHVAHSGLSCTSAHPLSRTCIV